MTDERRAPRPAWLTFAVVFAAALAIRAWTLLDEQHGNPLFRTAILDDGVYLRLAKDGAGDAWFLAPLYPWVLGAVASVPTMNAAGWVAAFAGSLTTAFVALAARTMHSPLAGWIAGGVTACAGVLVFHDVLPGQEPLLCLLHAMALWLAATYFRGEGTRWVAAAIGVLAGVAMLGRATSAALLGAFAVLALVRTAPRRRALAAVAITVAGAAAVLVPAAVAQSGAGAFTPLPWSGGPNLYMANGPTSRRLVSFAARELPMSPDAMADSARAVAETRLGRPLTPAEVSSFWTQKTLFDRDELPGCLLHLGRKALLFFSADEHGNTHDPSIERRWSTWLSIVPVTSWWILAGGVAGWWIARRTTPSLDFAALTVLATWIALTIFFPLSRYRLPVVPLAAAMMACGVAELLARRVTRHTVIVAAAIYAALTVVAHLPIREQLRARSWDNLAGAFAAEGDRASAMEMLRNALAEEPDDGPAHEHLGRFLLDENRPAEALEELKAAQRDDRTKWSAGVPAVRALTMLGRAEEALRVGAALRERLTDERLRAELDANLAAASRR